MKPDAREAVVTASTRAPRPTEGQPLIEARRLRKYFRLQPSVLARLLAGARESKVRAVDGVDLRIWSGETVGLVGESGCGKTTLGRLLVRLHEPSEGEILFQGRPLSGRSVVVAGENGDVGERLMYYRVAQIIFQNPYSSLNPRRTVREIVATPLSRRGLDDAQHRDAEIVRLLRRVGLSERHLDSYPHQFSGGQRQRIGIARALAMRPKFVVADEPVSSLDVSIQAQVINLLEELQEEYGLTFLFISHDLSVIHYMSSRVAVMYLGRIVEEAPTEELFARPRHPYSQALLAAVPRVRKEARRERILLSGSPPSPIDPPSGCPFHPRCFAKVGRICEERYPPMFEVGGSKVACWIYDGHPVAAGAQAEDKPQEVSQ